MNTHLFQPIKGLFIFVLFTLGLTACQFHLMDMPKNLKERLPQVQLLPDTPFDPFHKALRKHLVANGVLVVPPSELPSGMNVPIVYILEKNLYSHILAYGPRGKERRERLKLELKYAYVRTLGQNQLPSRTVFAQRERVLNFNQDLGDMEEKKLLEQEMHQDIISQIIHQLATRA